jgi:hypothetical protein
MMKISNKEFDELICKTRLNGAGVEAARLHFVDGVENLAECARICGVTRTVSSRIVARIRSEMLATGGLIEVTYTIPGQFKSTLDDYVKKLVKEV